MSTVPDEHSRKEQSRRELGAFLRSRREAITPDQVGLPGTGRRRTPGLRREEVAQLAGVGVTWYTWLEQGRDITVSGQVLEAISRTLMLDPAERNHLFTLAAGGEHEMQKECQSLFLSIQVILDGLNPFPAAVQNARFQLLAFVAEPAWKSLVGRLVAASPEFAEMWERHEVRGPENRTKHLINPKVGLLRLDYTYLWFGPRLGTRLVTYTPADASTQTRLEKLACQRAAEAAGAAGAAGAA